MTLRENEPPTSSIVEERDPTYRVTEYEVFAELAPNVAQQIDRAELKDLDRRIHAPVTVSARFTKKMQSNRRANQVRKDLQSPVWTHQLQGTWKRKAK